MSRGFKFPPTWKTWWSQSQTKTSVSMTFERARRDIYCKREVILLESKLFLEILCDRLEDFFLKLKKLQVKINQNQEILTAFLLVAIQIWINFYSLIDTKQKIIFKLGSSHIAKVQKYAQGKIDLQRFDMWC